MFSMDVCASYTIHLHRMAAVEGLQVWAVLKSDCHTTQVSLRWD